MAAFARLIGPAGIIHIKGENNRRPDDRPIHLFYFWLIVRRMHSPLLLLSLPIYDNFMNAVPPIKSLIALARIWVRLSRKSVG